jgi:hypothetical protein
MSDPIASLKRLIEESQTEKLVGGPFFSPKKGEEVKKEDSAEDENISDNESPERETKRPHVRRENTESDKRLNVLKKKLIESIDEVSVEDLEIFSDPVQVNMFLSFIYRGRLKRIYENLIQLLFLMQLSSGYASISWNLRAVSNIPSKSSVDCYFPR